MSNPEPEPVDQKPKSRIETLETRIEGLSREIDSLKTTIGNIPDLLQATFSKYDETVNNKLRMVSDSVGKGGSKDGGEGFLTQILRLANTVTGAGTNPINAEINDLANKIMLLSFRTTLKNAQKAAGIVDHITVEGK